MSTDRLHSGSSPATERFPARVGAVWSKTLAFTAAILVIGTVAMAPALRNPQPPQPVTTAGVALPADRQARSAAALDVGSTTTLDAGPASARADGTPSLAQPRPSATRIAAAGERVPTDWMQFAYPRLARLAELENLPADAALAEILPLLSDEDPVLRIAALEAIAAMNHPSRTSLLAAALADELPQIRIIALEALALHADDAARSLSEAWLYDADMAVRLAAIDAFAANGNSPAIDALAGLLFDAQPRIRLRALNAIGEIGGDSAVRYIEQLRYDPDPDLRQSARAILAEIR